MNYEDYGFHQANISTSTGEETESTKYLTTDFLEFPLGSYAMRIPTCVVSSHTTSGSSSTYNGTVYIFFYDKNKIFVGYYGSVSLATTVNFLSVSSLRTIITSYDVRYMKYRVHCGNGDIYPKDTQIVSTTTYYTLDTFNTEYDKTEWYIDGDSLSTEDMPSIEHDTIIPPLPLSYWRISDGYNNGFPYHLRLQDIPYEPEDDSLKPPILYRITCDGSELYSTNGLDPDLALIAPKLTLEDSKAGSLEFTVPPNHVLYNYIYRFKSILKVYKNDKEIFEGRVLSESTDIYNQRNVICEGELAYLNDTRQPQYEYIYQTGDQILRAIIGIHNEKVGENSNKRFKVGYVSPSTEYPTETQYWYTQFESSLESVNRLAEDLEMHIRVYKDSETGERTISMFKEITQATNQKIIFGSNLLDFTRNYDMSNLATAILPLGKVDNDERKQIGDELYFAGGAGKEKYNYHDNDILPAVLAVTGYEAECGGREGRPEVWTGEAISAAHAAGKAEDLIASELIDQTEEGESVVRWLDVSAGDVFFLTSALKKRNKYDLYFYVVRDENGNTLISKQANTSEDSIDEPDIIENEKIECPQGSKTLIIHGDTRYSATAMLSIKEGRKLPDEIDHYVTIESVNNGDMYVKAQPRDVTTYDQMGNATTVTVDPLAEWGLVERTLELDDIEDPQKLKDAAELYLREYQFDEMEIELEAIDAKVLGLNVDDIDINLNIRCISPFHGMDTEFPISKMVINFQKPESNTITLNKATDRTLTATNNSIDSEIFEKLSKKGNKVAVIETAKSSAYEYIKSGTKGVVSLNQGNDGYISSITISNTPDWESAASYWIWNENGMAYMDRTHGRVDVGMTNTGQVIATNLVADSIIAGGMLSGTLTLGGPTGSDGQLQVLRGNTIGQVYPLAMEVKKSTGEVATYSTVTSDSYKWAAMVDGHLSFGIGNGVPQQDGERRENTGMQIGWEYDTDNIPHPTINTLMGQSWVGNDEGLYMRTTNLYISGPNNVGTGTGQTITSDTYAHWDIVTGFERRFIEHTETDGTITEKAAGIKTIWTRTLTFYKGILVSVGPEIAYDCYEL